MYSKIPDISLTAVKFPDISKVYTQVVTLYFKKNINYFYAVRISISLAILSEIFIQISYFSKSYARKQKWMFFLNTA